jgi:UDP-glucuronate decarboxylase
VNDQRVEAASFELLGNGRFEAHCRNVTFPLFVEVDEIDTLARPASSIHYQRDPAQATTTSTLTGTEVVSLTGRYFG